MNNFTATMLQDSFKKGDLSAEEILKHYFNQIELYEPEVGAFISLCEHSAFEKARALDEKRKKGLSLGKLAAVPVAVKDNINVKGTFTTCGSKFLTNYKSPYNATIVDLLEAEDAIIIGKTNMDEFAMGSSTENSAIKQTKNPWNLACSPGGSSGGSAACVAARFAPLAFGSDTGGSIRQPASLCGVVGYKPTYGRVSRYGLVAFGSSLDQIGPFATSSEDIALIMEVLGRHCPKDSTSIPKAPDSIRSQLQKSIAGMKIGVPTQFLEGLHTDTRRVFDTSINVLKELGATIVDVDLSILKYSIAVYYILATAEASTNLARFDGVRYGNRSANAKTLDEVYELSRQEGFGDEVKRRIMLGTFVLSAGFQDAYYKKAQKVRAKIIQKYNEALQLCDVIATPVSPLPAFEIGSIKDPLQMYLADIYTIGANLAGVPAISIPAGFTPDNKPVGMQLQGGQLQDTTVIHAAYQFEQKTKHTTILPPLFATRSAS